MRNMMLKIAAGAVGGAVATYLLTKSMALSKKLPARLQPPMPSRDPGDFMVAQGERLIGPLSPKMHSEAAHILQWAYGVSWPIGLAALSGKLGIRSMGKTVAAGALLGALVWAIGYAGWLPASGLMPQVHRVPLGKNASALASHVAYGALASLPLALTAPRLQA
jgi:hypothetical protein